MLRALHLFGQYLNPTENWAFRLIRHLPDVRVLVGAERFLKHNFYEPGFEFLEFPFRQWDRPRLGLAERATNAFISHVLLPRYPHWLARHAAPVDLVHSHFAYIGWQYRGLVKRLGAPHVVSCYGADYSRLPEAQPVWRDRLRELFACADLFLCEGAAGVQRLVELGCPPEKAAVQHLGVDTDTIPFAPRTKPAGRLRLLQIATFREKKGHRYTLEAFARALPDCPGATLTLVGGDPEGLRDGLRRSFAGTPAEAAVTWIDGIDFSRLHEFMKDYDVFIHPSCRAQDGDTEGGAPVVLLDAQATGMPVIATRHCDIPDEVLEGRTGLLAAEGDVEGLADAVRTFHRLEADAFSGWCTAARAHIETAYDCRRNARDLRSRYDEVRARHATITR